ncbi:MAG: AEC family transporter [Candidatus Omnitrophota bacterium]
MVTQVFAKVGALFLMLVIGALARRKKIITTESLDSLCRIVLHVTLPFLFIYILASRCIGDTIISLWTAPVFAVLVIFVGYCVSSITAKLIKVPEDKKGTFKFLISFQNSGFLAIPIGFALFGQDGVLYIIIFNIGFNLLLWTLGVKLMNPAPCGAGRAGPGASSKVGLLGNLVNTGTVALALGIIFGVFCVKLPQFFLDASRMMGDATIPLAMIVTGAILGGVAIRSGVDIKRIGAIVLCKLIIIPVIFLGLAKLLPNISDLMRSIIVLQACMPSAASSPLFAKRFGGDHDLAASAVFFTTLISIITIPFFMSLI